MVRDRGAKKPYSWWVAHGGNMTSFTIVSHEAFFQVTSFSCCEKN